MTLFWVFSGLLILLAVYFMLQPLIRVKSLVWTSNHGRRTENIALFKTHLEQLQREKNNNDLDETTFTHLKLELEKKLLMDVGPNNLVSRYPIKQGSWLLILIVLILPIAVWTGYKELGHYDGWRQQWALTESQHLFKDNPSQALARLQAELEVRPDHAEGWYWLANGYMSRSNYQQAAKSFAKVIALLPPDHHEYSEALSQYAQALFFVAGKITPAIKHIIEQTLAINSRQVTALSLQGIAAFEAHDYTAAIQHWQQALAYSDDDITIASLQAGIARVQKLLADNP